MTAPVAGDKNLAVARRIARAFGPTEAARELAAMLGLIDDAGYIAPDDERDIVIGFGAPKVAKPAREEHPLDLRARPKVSTAPDALRNLPPVVVEPKPVKVAAVKPKRVAAPKPAKVGVGRYTAPHGTYTALRRHRRLGEDPCELCVGAKSNDPNDRLRYEKRRRERGIEPRQLLPHGTEGAYRRHIKQKTQVCDACRASHRQRNRELEAAKRSAA